MRKGGEMLGEVSGECGGGEECGKCERVWVGVRGVWRDVLGECGLCGEEMLDEFEEMCRVSGEGVEKCVDPPHFSTPPYIPTHFPPLPHNLHTHPINSSTPPPHLPHSSSHH